MRAKFLYIEDDPELTMLMDRYFSKNGYNFLSAPNGRLGLEVFRNEQPDIMLVDLAMPEMDGFEVLEALSKEAQRIPIIVISGIGKVDDVVKALRLGAWDYLTKPVSDYILVRHSVEKALNQARLIKENVQYQKGLEEQVCWRTHELVQNEKKMSAIIEAFDGFIFTCDSNCRLTFMNSSLRSYTGRDASGEICFSTLFDLEDKCPWCPDDECIEMQPVRQEFKNPRNNCWYSVIQSPIVDRNENILERHVILFDITKRKQALIDLQESEEYLLNENRRLRASISDRYKFGNIIGRSKVMQEVYELIINAAATDTNVIIYGESGTGKELVAKAIHENSDRKNREMVYVNCGAIPEHLFESEFFGYKKGAFTGASKDKHGLLELADGSNLFLDEIGEIPINLQVKLLRAIEGGGYSPVGSGELKKTDVRIIAATNRDLKDAVKKGLMRQDFFYRIHVIPIHLPPLRERMDDIRLLIDHFLEQYDSEKIPPFTDKIRKALFSYDWPGNVRELQNTLHRFVTLKKLNFMGLDVSVAEEETSEVEVGGISLNEAVGQLERRCILRALEKNRWRKGDTADSLKIDPKTLARKMKLYGLKKNSPK